MRISLPVEVSLIGKARLIGDSGLGCCDGSEKRFVCLLRVIGLRRQGLEGFL